MSFAIWWEEKLCLLQRLICFLFLKRRIMQLIMCSFLSWLPGSSESNRVLHHHQQVVSFFLYLCFYFLTMLCGLQCLSFPTVDPGATAMKVPHPNHWTTSAFPVSPFLEWGPKRKIQEYKLQWKNWKNMMRKYLFTVYDLNTAHSWIGIIILN